ncbi:DMT family transporter [Streptomyces sp. URMC 123]|uniref:DMT family transporter n=1 Tax=Streptomyces sp. URMC 123 TaxID=3423403 RepID=UPI003F1A8547
MSRATASPNQDRAPEVATERNDGAADTPTGGAAGSAPAAQGRGRYQLMVLAAVCCLALGGVFVRVSEVGPVASGAYRSLFAAPMLLGLSLAATRRSTTRRSTTRRSTTRRSTTRRSAAGKDKLPEHKPSEHKPARISTRDKWIIALGGLFLAGDLCLWNISFLYTSLAEANLLANLVPFIIAPLCFFLFGDRVTGKLVFPALLALGGLYVLVILGTGLDADHLRGDILALVTAVFYALFLVVAKGLRERHEATRIMASLSLVCALVCFAVAAVMGEKIWPTTLRGWLLLIGLAVTSQVLGQTLMAHAVKFLPLQLAALFVLLQPVAAAVYGFVLFDQHLSLVQMAGIAILLVSIFWAKNLLEGRK